MWHGGNARGDLGCRQKTERTHDHPADNAALQFELLFDNPFVHSSMMLRKSALDIVGGYTKDPVRQPPEDYELWSRIARLYKVANLTERLTIYREVPRSMSRASLNPFAEKVLLISAENLAHAAGDMRPVQAHRDIAALTHRAFHAVSENPDIEQLCDIVAKAGNSIAPDGVDIEDRIQARIANLRRNHIEANLEKSSIPPAAGVLDITHIDLKVAHSTTCTIEMLISGNGAPENALTFLLRNIPSQSWWGAGGYASTSGAHGACGT